MSTTETYEGWSNRETWAVALHINNDQGWQESVHDALRRAPQWRPVNTLSAHDAGEIVCDSVERVLVPDHSLGRVRFSRDVWLAIDDIGSLWRVDWTELGEAFLTDLGES